MLMTFDPQGRVQFTRNPIALRLVEGLGKLSVTRMSEIIFDGDAQRYYIRFVTGYFANHVLRWEQSPFRNFNSGRERELCELWFEFCNEHSPAPANQHVDWSCTSVVMFPTYEDAVEIEVGFIDMLRERGIAVQ